MTTPATAASARFAAEPDGAESAADALRDEIGEVGGIKS